MAFSRSPSSYVYIFYFNQSLMLSAFCLRIYVYGLWSMVYGNYYHISFFFLNGYDMI